MDIISLISGSAYTALLLILSVISLRLTLLALRKLNGQSLGLVSGLKENNISIAILYAGVILSVTLIMRNSISGGMLYLHDQLYRSPFELGNVGIALGLICLQFFVSFLFSLVSIFSSLKIYSHITADVDELAEIKNNNTAVAIVLSAVLTAISLFIAPGVEMIVGSIIPFVEH